MMKTLSCLFILIISFGCSAELETINITDYEGYWSLNCETLDSGIKFGKSNINRITVASSQIYVNARFEQQDNSYILYLDSLDQMGRGGMAYNWDKVSYSLPLGKLSIKDSFFILDWNGFYNEQDGKYMNIQTSFDNTDNLLKPCN